MKCKPLIAVVGPTASGKSNLAMQLAQMHSGELICADSRTVYRGLDIGTAKPSVEEQSKIPHHLIDIVNPDEVFNAAMFQRLALDVIEDIHLRGKLPIIVGGTGLYVDAVLFNLSFGEPADLARRAQLNALPVEELQLYCKSHNIPLPENAKNKRYLVRAIELGGLKQEEKRLRPDTLVVGISTDKEVLKARIEKRSHIMVEHGIVQEVARLGQIYGWDNEAMKGNVYRIFKGVVEGSKPLSQALTECIYSDLHLAKRQITWFKRNPHVHWGNASGLKIVAHHFLKSTGYIS